MLVRITTKQGVVGWGETYGIVAPRATMEIIADLLAGFVIGRDPRDVAAIHDDLYDLMRVRGYTGGYYLDALAAIDIALWDIAAQSVGLPLAKYLGGQRRETIPAYLSGCQSQIARHAPISRWNGRRAGSTASNSPRQ